MIAFHANFNVQKAAKPPLKPRRRNIVSRQEAVVLRMSNAMSVNLVTGVESFKRDVSEEDLATAWASRDYSKVRELVPWTKLEGHLAPAAESLGHTAVKGAAHQLETLPANANKRLRLDLTNPDIHHYVRKRTGALITTLERGVQDSVQNAVAKSFTNALTPRQVAAQIKGSIGLLPTHEIAVANYRAGLLQSGMRPEAVEKLARAYENRLLDYRARNIARTETRRAFQEGQLSVWHEGRRQNLFKGGSKVWLVDGNPCEICEPMDGEAVGLEDSFEVEYPNGEVLEVQYPSESHPSCECSMNLEFDHTEGF